MMGNNSDDSPQTSTITISFDHAKGQLTYKYECSLMQAMAMLELTKFYIFSEQQEKEKGDGDESTKI